MKSRLIAQILVIVLSIAFVSIQSGCTDLKEELSKHYRIMKPEGTGPFPAVMMVPGCSGFELGKESYDRVQKRLRELGFATLRVDSLAARNATDCRLAQLLPQKGADDIYIAAEY